MANIVEKVISILAGNLNSGLSYLITTVHVHFSIHTKTKTLFSKETPQERSTSKDSKKETRK